MHIWKLCVQYQRYRDLCQRIRIPRQVSGNFGTAAVNRQFTATYVQLDFDLARFVFCDLASTLWLLQGRAPPDGLLLHHIPGRR